MWKAYQVYHSSALTCSEPINTLLFKLMYLTKYHLGVIKGNS